MSAPEAVEQLINQAPQAEVPSLSIVQPEAKVKRRRAKRKQIPSYEAISKQFHLPLKEAVSVLGVCGAVIKKICLKNGTPRWPYRKVVAYQRATGTTDAEDFDKVAASPASGSSKARQIAKRKASKRARNQQPYSDSDRTLPESDDESTSSNREISPGSGRSQTANGTRRTRSATNQQSPQLLPTAATQKVFTPKAVRRAVDPSLLAPPNSSFLTYAPLAVPPPVPLPISAQPLPLPPPPNFHSPPIMQQQQPLAVVQQGVQLLPSLSAIISDLARPMIPQWSSYGPPPPQQQQQPYLLAMQTPQQHHQQYQFQQLQQQKYQLQQQQQQQQQQLPQQPQQLQQQWGHPVRGQQWSQPFPGS